MTSGVHTIAPGESFLDVLVDAILSGSIAGFDRPPEPLQLTRWTVLVPTRRAARALMAAFLDHDNRARLLPVIRPIGDVDEDAGLIESAADAGALDVPPAISAFRRQFLLAHLLQDWAGKARRLPLARTIASSAGLTLELARSLAELIDQFENEDVPLEALTGLFDDDLPEHRLDVLSLLAVVRDELPERMAARGVIGPVARRNRLIEAEAARLAENPPDMPVIAAGSTGSIRATAKLLAAVASLPRGAVVLPGLDQTLDEASWDAIEPQHPQFGMKQLLARLGIGRHAVRPLGPPSAKTGRAWLLSEVMRPTATTEQWRETVATARDDLSTASAGLKQITVPGQREEAAVIALILRRALEDQSATASLVTPDRTLARRVKAELTRFDIAIDDTAGEPLSRTAPGALLLSVLDGAVNGFTGSRLMAVLNHPLCCLGRSRAELSRLAGVLEAGVLRGNVRATGANGLEQQATRLGASDAWKLPRPAQVDEAGRQAVAALARQIEQGLAPLEAMMSSGEALEMPDLMMTHIRACEQLTADEDGGTSSLWTGDAGETLSATLRELNDDAKACPPLTGRDYLLFLRRMLASAALRPAEARHARLRILGLLEARLIRSDVMVLGGLNEGVWPAEPDVDPWLNRPQKRLIDLSLPERRIGLAAHDFVQAAANREVWLTCCDKRDGSPAVASRWLMRLNTILNAAGLKDVLKPEEPWTGWATGLDQPPGSRVRPIPQPLPKPAVRHRPDQLSVTRIGLLVTNPYAVYGQKILGLDPLEPLDGEAGPRERGIIMHDVLHRFYRDPANLSGTDAATKLYEALVEGYAAALPAGDLVRYWQPQLARVAHWLIGQEHGVFADAARRHLECSGEMQLPLGARPFTLTAKADRIDQLAHGGLRIVDYKTGTVPGLKPGAQNYSPQLDLEALVVSAGGFKAVTETGVAALCYIRLTGREPPGQVSTQARGIEERTEATRQGLLQLLTAYENPAQPYVAIWRRDTERQEGDWDHLSRWREWGHVLTGTDDEAR